MPSLTSSASCLYPGCPWAAEGDWAAVDKAAERHTTREPKHPTSTETRAT